MHAHSNGLAPRWEIPFSVVAGALLAGGLALEHFGPAAFAPYCYVLALILAGAFPLRAALLSLRALRPDVETLMILAGIGAALLGHYFEGAFLLFLFSLGHAFEHRAMDKARRSVEALGRLRPETARLRRGDTTVDTAVTMLERGDMVLVCPGDRVPTDGVIRVGETTLDEATLTGESMPVAKSIDGNVFAGTLNLTGAIDVEVTKRSSDSMLARIVDMVAEAEAQKSQLQRFALSVERRFVPVVLALAVVFPVFLIATGTPWRMAFLRAVSLIVAASPCALAISTPAAVLSAVARAARGGVLIKGGLHLDALAAVRSIAFDKTGTLTVGAPTLGSIVVLGTLDENSVLAKAAALESMSTHPLARALVTAAKNRSLAIAAATKVNAVHGKGVRGEVDGVAVALGSASLFEPEPNADIQSKARVLEEAGNTVVYVQIDGHFVAVLALTDEIRPNVKATLATLAKMGIERSIMVSGDNARAAKRIAQAIGIREVRAPVLPMEKAATVRELEREAQVAMVGDGVNDAPALAAASVGIAMGGTASDAALQTADVVLMSDRFDRLPFVFALARQSARVIKQNLAISLGVSVLLIVLTLLDRSTMTYAVILHEGSTVLVVINALRLLRFSS